MHKSYEALCSSLDDLSSAVLNAIPNDQTLQDQFGWHCPAMTRIDLAAIATRLASDIRSAKREKIEPSIRQWLDDLPRRILDMRKNTVPYLNNSSNSFQSSFVYTSTLQMIRSGLFSASQWEIVDDKALLPVHIMKRLKSIEAQINQIEPDILSLEQTINSIKEGHKVAESLPIDLAALNDARNKVETITGEIATLMQSASDNADIAYKSSQAAQHFAQETESLAERCEDEYRVVTTKGLAASFSQRAATLTNSLWLWTVGLISALSSGAYIGYDRIPKVSALLNTQQIDFGVLALHISMSIVGIGAPIWFAWLATKQIGQRFRLSEDYAFKATVAKAYEGYRREAARYDNSFSARLFDSALSRLEESPLRLIESKSHGSPWHELLEKCGIPEMIGTLPELKEKMIEACKSSKAPQKPKAKAKRVDTSASE